MDKQIQLSPGEFSRIKDVVDMFLENGASNNNPKFTAIVGPIASGKTTIRKEKYSDGYTLIDAGELFDSYKKDDIDNSDKMEEILLVAGIELVRGAVSQKKNIVIEIAADTPEREKTLSSILKKMTELGYDAASVYIHCEPEECMKRNMKGRDNVSSYYSTDETLHYFMVYFSNI